MPIKLKCPKCGESYKVADDRAGKKFRCRKCQGPVKVPVDMFVATLDKMEMEMASEMESDGDALNMDELMALSEEGDTVQQPGQAPGTSAAASPPWMAIAIGVILVGGIAAGLFAWLM
jgi:hypothetical protein